MSLKEMVRDLIPYRMRKKIFDLVPRERTGIAGVLERIDRNSSMIFDIGANVGDVTLYLLRRFPRATVYSFEPCTETFSRLTDNLRMAGYGDRARPFRLGFYDRDMEGTLNVTSFHGANSMMQISEEYRTMNPHIEAVRVESIPLVRLDDFVVRQGLGRIDLVKIDVEGVERQILEGGRKTLASMVDAVIMEMSFVRHSREEAEFIKLFTLMHELGFAPAEIFDLEHSASEDTWRLAQFDCLFRRYRPLDREEM